jgi:6-phosphogluconate dehydrogenase
MSAQEMGEVFSEWNSGMLDSFLIEITADILKQADPETGKPFVDIRARHSRPEGNRQMDERERAGHGRAGPDGGGGGFCPLPERGQGRARGRGEDPEGPGRFKFEGDKGEFIQAIHDALYCSKICSYAQGFQLMREAQKEYDWKLNFGEIAQIWRGGCIIRAVFLQKITEAYEAEPELANLLLNPYFNETIQKAQANWRKVIGIAAQAWGSAFPTFSSALSLLRRLPHGPPAAESPAGPADYFRRPHLRAHGQGARQVLPHRLAGPKARPQIEA